MRADIRAVGGGGAWDRVGGGIYGTAVRGDTPIIPTQRRDVRCGTDILSCHGMTGCQGPPDRLLSHALREQGRPCPLDSDCILDQTPCSNEHTLLSSPALPSRPACCSPRARYSLLLGKPARPCQCRQLARAPTPSSRTWLLLRRRRQGGRAAGGRVEERWGLYCV